MPGFSDNEYYGRSFTGLEWRGQSVEKTEFESCLFSGCDFSATTFRNCRFIDCGFNDCNLANILPHYSTFNDVTFTACKLTGVDWSRAAWPLLQAEAPLTFIRCVISLSGFMGLALPGLILEDCRAHEVDFRDGDFSGGRFTGTDFGHSLFGNTRLVECDFSDASGYNIDIRNCDVRQARFSRYEAVRLLEILGIEITD